MGTPWIEGDFGEADGLDGVPGSPYPRLKVKQSPCQREWRLTEKRELSTGKVLYLPVAPVWDRQARRSFTGSVNAFISMVNSVSQGL